MFFGQMYNQFNPLMKKINNWTVDEADMLKLFSNVESIQTISS